MTDEIRYKVGVFTVTLVKSPEEAVRPWDDVSCECEEWTKNQQNVMRQTPDEEKCRHIREAEMYHHYEQKVTPVENE